MGKTAQSYSIPKKSLKGLGKFIFIYKRGVTYVTICLSEIVTERANWERAVANIRDFRIWEQQQVFRGISEAIAGLFFLKGQNFPPLQPFRQNSPWRSR